MGLVKESIKQFALKWQRPPASLDKTDFKTLSYRAPSLAKTQGTKCAAVFLHSPLKPRPMGGVMFIGYAIETLRDEAPLHAASTPTVEAVLAAGYDYAVGASNEAMVCTPRLGLQRTLVVVSSGRCGIAATLIPSLRTENVKNPLGGPDQGPVLWAGILYAATRTATRVRRFLTRKMQHRGEPSPSLRTEIR